jgi:hypothetical protein
MKNSLFLHGTLTSSNRTMDISQYLGFLLFLFVFTAGFWLLIFLLTFVVPYWITGTVLENLQLKKEAKAKK